MTSGTVTATLTLVDLVSVAPVPSVAARVCRKLDVECSQPLLTGLLSDSKGTLSVAVPVGFDGYVELSPPNAIAGLYFFYPPVTTSRQVPAIPLMSADSLAYLAQLAGAPLNSDHSSVFLGAHNCLDEPAGGVQFSSADADSATHPFYLINGIPSASAKETDAEGRGGLLNMKIGSITVSGALASGQPIATASVFTRPNYVTYAALVPSPN